MASYRCHTRRHTYGSPQTTSSLTRQESVLYNGVSNRSRGWKTRRSVQESVESSTSATAVRWDGASRSRTMWDNLRRDPELWYRDGNCHIHLHGPGQSQRGPAFKIPFSVLLEMECFPLLRKFVSHRYSALGEPRSLEDTWEARMRSIGNNQPVELYIPAPPQSDKTQSFSHHLATRNFFAFLCRRSMVGENLGDALISVMHSLYEFRSEGADNVGDMLSYLDEEGYLSFKNQPSHAVAILRLAEVFQVRDLYIDAFAHCCGMSGAVFFGPEYQLLSSVTRKLMRRARVDMDLRLGQCGSMLRSFLQDELSEAHLGLCPGARAHLERFRTLLQGVYSTKFGYYPPPSIVSKSTVFDVAIYRAMRTDFEALYQYLVNEAFDASMPSPFMATGGICTLQSVQSFDARYTYTTLPRPLPLLPVMAEGTTRRSSWFGRQIKPTVAQKSAEHVALLKATNRERASLLGNKLVKAYMQFEYDSIYTPIKADRQENLGLVDARKVRWILIYAIYQTLRQATEPPPEVKDAEGAPYNLCISTQSLPPWTEEPLTPALAKHQVDMITRNPSTTTSEGSWVSNADSPSFGALPEIKPDINYFALNHRDDGDVADNEQGSSTPPRPTRRYSLTRTLSRSSAIRRSWGLFGRANDSEEKLVAPEPSARKGGSHPQYHEIVVRGYGNGTMTAAASNLQQQMTTSPVEEVPSPMVEFNTRPFTPSVSSDSIASNGSSGSRSDQDQGQQGQGQGTAATSPNCSPTDVKNIVVWPSGGARSATPAPGASISGRPASVAGHSRRNSSKRLGSLTGSVSFISEEGSSSNNNNNNNNNNDPLPQNQPNSPTFYPPRTASMPSVPQALSLAIWANASTPTLPVTGAPSTGGKRGSMGARRATDDAPAPLNIRKGRLRKPAPSLLPGSASSKAAASPPARLRVPLVAPVAPKSPTSWFEAREDDSLESKVMMRLGLLGGADGASGLAAASLAGTAADNDIKPEWEQFTDLGGFTEFKMGTPTPTATTFAAASDRMRPVSTVF